MFLFHVNIVVEPTYLFHLKYDLRDLCTSDAFDKEWTKDVSSFIPNGVAFGKYADQN
jgi:hypothetical protein